MTVVYFTILAGITFFVNLKIFKNVPEIIFYLWSVTNGFVGFFFVNKQLVMKFRRKVWTAIKGFMKIKTTFE